MRIELNKIERWETEFNKNKVRGLISISSKVRAYNL